LCVAQFIASTPELIYEALTGSPEFMAEVGTYTFANRSTAPSISIVSPGADLPAVSKQVGLEVVIQDIAEMDKRLYLTNSPDLLFTWKVFLISWSPSTGANITNALRLMGGMFPLSTAVQVVNIGNTLGVESQTQVRIPSDCPIVPAGVYEPGVFDSGVFFGP